MIENAIKFHGDKKPGIEINCRKEKNNFLFSVRDNGCGIEAEFYERIFQPFRKLTSKIEDSGTGMGLAICKKVVERHGGNILWLCEQKSILMDQFNRSVLHEREFDVISKTYLHNSLASCQHSKSSNLSIFIFFLEFWILNWKLAVFGALR